MSLTNTQLLVHLCEHSKTGALTQVVMMEAILSYSERVIGSPSGFLGQAAQLANEDAWRSACKEILAAHEDRTSIPVPVAPEVQEMKDLMGDMLSMLQDLYSNFGWDELSSTLEDVQERAAEFIGA